MSECRRERVTAILPTAAPIGLFWEPLAQPTRSSRIPGVKTIILIPAGDLVKSEVSVSVSMAGRTGRAGALTAGGDGRATSVTDR